MAEATRLPGDVLIGGNLVVGGDLPVYPRSRLRQENEAVLDLPLESFRVHDAYATNLPGTSAADDLALVGGTFGTNGPAIETYDVKAAGSQTLRARTRFKLPPEYIATETVKLRIKAGMVTSIADVACTVDAEARKSDGFGGVGADLVSDAAQSINSLTPGAFTFRITAASLAPGDEIDLRITIAANDAATVTAVIARIGEIALLLDIKG